MTPGKIGSPVSMYDERHDQTWFKIRYRPALCRKLYRSLQEGAETPGGSVNDATDMIQSSKLTGVDPPRRTSAITDLSVRVCRNAPNARNRT